MLRNTCGGQPVILVSFDLVGRIMWEGNGKPEKEAVLGDLEVGAIMIIIFKQRNTLIQLKCL